MSDLLTLTAQPLTASAFADYGDVIECAGRDSFPINQGIADRYHDLARVETHGEAARTAHAHLLRLCHRHWWLSRWPYCLGFQRLPVFRGSLVQRSPPCCIGCWPIAASQYGISTANPSPGPVAESFARAGLPLEQCRPRPLLNV